MFERIQRWYCLGLWTEVMVKNALDKGVITQSQYDAIVSM